MVDKSYRLRRIQRSGNSGQLNLPMDIMKAMGLQKGDIVMVYMVGRVGCFKAFRDGGFTPDVVAVTRTPEHEAR